MKNQNEMILMQDLSKKEMKEVNGGYWPVIVIAIVAPYVAHYVVNRYFRR